jgi:hypothetical protein
LILAAFNLDWALGGGGSELYVFSLTLFRQSIAVSR